MSTEEQINMVKRLKAQAEQVQITADLLLKELDVNPKPKKPRNWKHRQGVEYYKSLLK